MKAMDGTTRGWWRPTCSVGTCGVFHLPVDRLSDEICFFVPWGRSAAKRLRCLVALVQALQGHFHDEIDALFLSVLMTNRAGLSGMLTSTFYLLPSRVMKIMSTIDEVKNVDERFADGHLR